MGARCRGRCWGPGAAGWRRGHCPPLSASTGTRCRCSSALVCRVPKDTLVRVRGIHAEEQESDTLRVCYSLLDLFPTHAMHADCGLNSNIIFTFLRTAYVDKPRPDTETRSPPHSLSVLCTSTGRRPLPVVRAIVRCAIMGVPTRPQASPGHLTTRAPQATPAPALAPRRTPTAETRQPAAVTGASI